jgi:prophage maintenance system killer protein
VEIFYAMRYLSVHDLLWVNRTVTGAVLSFDFETLEACVAAQYDYGAVRGVAENAASLLADLLKHRPVAYGNRRTALLATAAFLLANGASLRDSTGTLADLLQRCQQGEIGSGDVVEAFADVRAEPGGEDGRGIQAIVAQARCWLAPTLDALAEGDGPNAR